MAAVIAGAQPRPVYQGRSGTALLRQDRDQVAVLLVTRFNAEPAGEETGYGGFG
jgi:hypothetical protein